MGRSTTKHGGGKFKRKDGFFDLDEECSISCRHAKILKERGQANPVDSNWRTGRSQFSCRRKHARDVRKFPAIHGCHTKETKACSRRGEGMQQRTIQVVYAKKNLRFS